MAEPLIIPALSSPYQRLLVVCGKVTADDEATKKLFSEMVESLFIYRQEPQGQYVRISIGSNAHQMLEHFHIDIASPEYFDKAPPPEGTPDDAMAAVARFYGLPIKVRVRGKYVVPQEKLPTQGLIRSAMIELKLGDVSVKQTSATFSMSGKGAALCEVKWSFDSDEEDSNKKITIEFEIITTTTIDSSYLSRLYDLSSKVFRVSILGEQLVEK